MITCQGVTGLPPGSISGLIFASGNITTGGVFVSRIERKTYSYAYLIPGGIIFFTFYLLPTFASLFFSMTHWTLTDWTFIGFENFRQFFSESNLTTAFKNTLIYAVLTSGTKVVLGLIFGSLLSSQLLKIRGYLRSVLFFPNLLSTIAVGYTFTALMHPTKGVINTALATIGVTGPDWLGNVNLALYSVILVDVWKGVGVATVIYIAGIMSIPQQYYEAAMIDGAATLQKFRHITLPLSRPAMNSVIILSFIGGLRTFDLVWAMTKGGPGFATELLASVNYKMYTAGFYGLSTAGNVIMFLLVGILAFPLWLFLTKREVDM